MKMREYVSAEETLLRYVLVASEIKETPYLERKVFDSPEIVFNLVSPFLSNADREHSVLVSLDSKHRVTSLRLSSVGVIDHTFMSPREIFRDAISDNASAIIIVHNHPSGDPTPSSDDKNVTHRIKKAGDIIGIDVLDHIVVGADTFTSMARMGEL
jgi:DNA repair protein RadC